MADPLLDMCPGCGREFGNHTLRDMAACGQHGYSLDWQPLETPGSALVQLEDIAGGPMAAPAQTTPFFARKYDHNAVVTRAEVQ